MHTEPLITVQLVGQQHSCSESFYLVDVRTCEAIETFYSKLTVMHTNYNPNAHTRTPLVFVLGLISVHIAPLLFIQ